MSPPIFADAFYFLALLNPRDQDHDRAARLGRRPLRGTHTSSKPGSVSFFPEGSHGLRPARRTR